VSAAAGLGGVGEGAGTAAAVCAGLIEGIVIVRAAAMGPISAAARTGTYRDIRTLRKKKLDSRDAAEKSARRLGTG